MTRGFQHQQLSGTESGQTNPQYYIRTYFFLSKCFHFSFQNVYNLLACRMAIATQAMPHATNQSLFLPKSYC